MKTRSHFTFRIDVWTANGESIVEHVADVEDYQVALATFRAACERWPGVPITLRQGAHVIEDSRRLRLAWTNKGRQGVKPRSKHTVTPMGPGGTIANGPPGLSTQSRPRAVPN